MAGDGWPSSWEVRRLDEVSRIVDSLHKTPTYTIVGLPMVRVTDIRGGFLDLSSALLVSEEVFAEFTRRHTPRPGDIVFSRVGTYGNASYVNTDMPFCLGQNTAIISPTINPRFVHLCLESAAVRHQIEQSVVGSTQKTISLKHIKALQIPFPPASEREAIAHILGTLDDKIELNRRMNETLEGMARALFKSWFVDFDPVRAKMDGRPVPGLDAATAALFADGFEDSELGHIPKGWKVGSIGDVGENPRRGISPDSIPEGTAYIALEHMPRRSIALCDWGVADEIGSTKCQFRRGEILFGKLRPYFHKVGVPAVDGICSTDILVITARTPTWFGLLLGHMSSDELVSYTDMTSTGTKMPRTNWKDIARFEIVLPPADIAEVFGARMRAIVGQMHANIHQSRTLASLRDALLPKLLSGEIRVGDADKYVDAAIDVEGPEPLNPTEATVQVQGGTSKSQEPKQAPSVKREVPGTVDLDTDVVMCAFREAARGQGEMGRKQLLSLVARRLGYGRLGRNIRHTLKGHMRAAIRRKIISANGQAVWAETFAISDYKRDDLIDTLCSVMRKNTEYDREDVIERVARYLGFVQVRDTVEAPIKSAINAGIRRGVLGGNQKTVWREE